MWQIQEVKQLLEQSQQIVITTHRNPDGDAIGSSLGLMHYLHKRGIPANVVTPTDYGDFLKWMPGNEEVVIYENDKAKGCQLFENADLIFCLDFNDTQRTENLQPVLDEMKAPKILVDHHLDPKGFQDYGLWDSSAAATAELIFDLINDLGHKDEIDKSIGSCLYTGIVTDSGSFRFASTTSRLHQIAAFLLEKGVDHVSIHEKIYDSFTENSLRFFGHCFTERLHVFEDYKTAIIEVRKEDLEQFGVSSHQTDGLVNFALSLQHVVFAAIIKENDQLTKISFRSKGRFPANEFARDYFEGGGHLNAAGGKSDKGISETLENFKKHLASYQNLLLSS